MEKCNTCPNCEYEKLSLTDQVCFTCIAYSNWQPKIIKETIGMNYTDHVYKFVHDECKDLDSIYEDYIIRLVGEYGLRALLDGNWLEGCGFLNNRKLYVLLDKKKEE